MIDDILEVQRPPLSIGEKNCTRAAVHCLQKPLHNVAHMALLAATADIVPLAAEDTNPRLKIACRADKDARKVDLGIRLYRDDNAEQWVLPVVKMAEDILRIDRLPNHEYLPIPSLAISPAPRQD